MYFLCDLYAELRASGADRDVRHFGDVIFQRGRERETQERAHEKTVTTRNKINIAEIDEALFSRFFFFFFFLNCGSWSFHLFQAPVELFSIEI